MHSTAEHMARCAEAQREAEYKLWLALQVEEDERLELAAKLQAASSIEEVNAILHQAGLLGGTD